MGIINDVTLYDGFATYDRYYIHTGGRGCGRAFASIPRTLQFLFGGKCEYVYDAPTMTHHYLIINDDIGFMDMTVTNECFICENANVRLRRMCEEYDGYMRYKYRDYINN